MLSYQLYPALAHQNMEFGGSTLCVFLDLAKAFDTVSHSCIIQAHSKAEITGSLLTWFHSYLSDRHQFSSCPVNVTSGVPREVLGPLLFI